MIHFEQNIILGHFLKYLLPKLLPKTPESGTKMLLFGPNCLNLSFWLFPNLVFLVPEKHNSTFCLNKKLPNWLPDPPIVVIVHSDTWVTWQCCSNVDRGRGGSRSAVWCANGICHTSSSSPGPVPGLSGLRRSQRWDSCCLPSWSNLSLPESWLGLCLSYFEILSYQIESDIIGCLRGQFSGIWAISGCLAFLG